MRLSRLDLIRYGRFTDRVIDFGRAAAGTPDLHVIHGPNEAGKSTLFSAWLDFLYGIPGQSPYNFIHDYKTMRIGARIETQGEMRDFLRVKKPSASLLDGNEQPVGDGALLGELGGLDRDAYRTMFSLDETSLEQGGEAILASKGDLGQLLFSASAGLSDLALRLDRVREETDLFHRPRAQKSLLAELKRRLDDLKTERDRIDLAAGEHARLVTERERARAAHEDAGQRRVARRVALEAANRRLAALPQFARLRDMRLTLADMDDPPAAPAEWRASLAQLRRQDVELATALGRIERDLLACEASLAARPPRDPILDHAAEIEALQAPAGRAASEAQDLPNRRAEHDQVMRSIADLVRRLGRDPTEPARALLLPARNLGTLRDLMTGHSGITERFEAGRRELRAATDALETARRAEGLDGDASADPDPDVLKRLAGELTVLRTTDLAARQARARQVFEEARRQLGRRIDMLAPWRGEERAFAALIAPAPQVLAALAARLTDAASASVRARAERDRLVLELVGLEAERETLAAVPGLVDDAAAEEFRRNRDAAWSRHRATLDGASADAFQVALEADDRATGRRLAQATETALMRASLQALARVTARLAAAETMHAQAEAQEALVRGQLAQLVAATSQALPETMDLPTFQGWCDRLAAAQDALKLADSAERDLRAATDALDETARRLSALSEAIGITPVDTSLDQLAADAQRVLDAEAARVSHRAMLRERQAELERRQRAFSEAEQAGRAWEEAWAAALAGTWLVADGTIPSVGEMQEILDTLQSLDKALEAADGLADRIAKMERDIDAFASDVDRIARSLGVVEAETSHRLHRLLAERCASAREHETRRRDDEKRLAILRDERLDMDSRRVEVAEAIAAMAAHFGVTTAEAVEEKLALQAERSALQTEIHAVARGLAESLGADGTREAEAELAGIDRSTLEAQIEALRPECAALDEETSLAYAAFSAASQKLAGLGSDAEAARLAEARRTVLIEIEEGARHYLELKLGALATDHALRLYRDRHRSSMMQRASEAFAQLSRGNYRGLAAQRDGQRETLVALGADGSSKQADAMSKGTQFQLYLALRVAGYQEYAATRPPVPFIADDIMESFDEQRAAEALTQLTRMAASGQVIYLTHHQHICDIAREICPTVTLHAL